MNPEIRYQEITSLPKLSWLADMEVASCVLTVIHGTCVERRDEWLVEGVWDGDFSLGNFHRSENFFGSGVRIEEGAVYFVPSSSLVDRLIYCTHGRNLLVSNSLPLLFAFTGARLDPNHSYYLETWAIMKGLREYDRRLVVLHPEIECFFQAYGDNIVVKDGNISVATRTRAREIDSFSTYVGLLQQALRGIRGNYESNSRRFPVATFMTMSTGYDSPAVAVLVKDIGVQTCFSSRRSNTTVPAWVSRRAAIDDAKPIADRLGLQTIHLDPSRSNIGEDELYFLAPNCAETEIVFYSMAKHIEASGRVAAVFTGNMGGNIWDLHLGDEYLGDAMKRKDPSGQKLGEIRLKSGFFHVDVPSMYAKSVRSIVAIARSLEMRPWTLQKAYDRPIPRRIVESAGVERELFGYRKKAVIQKYSYPVNRVLRKRFFEFLREQHGVPRGFVYGIDVIERLATTVATIAIKLKAMATGVPATSKPIILSRKIDLSHLMFFWALTTLSERLALLLRRDRASVAG